MHAYTSATDLRARAIARHHPDGETSVAYANGEAAFLHGRDEIPLPVRRWLDALHLVEEFARVSGRAPRENTRNRSTLDAYERRLGEWSRRQRECWHRLSAYQQARLEVSPAFSLDRQESRWSARWEACRRMIIRTGRLPVLAQANPAEFTLARWWRRQLALNKVGRLSSDRAARVEELLAVATGGRDSTVRSTSHRHWQRVS
jgi:hypothetical protein